MFIKNKYYELYIKLINDSIEKEENFKNSDKYGEIHHIKPRSMGGNNDPNNLVFLSARRHFLAHWILTKCTKGTAYLSMFKAFHMMSTAITNKKYIRNYKINSKIFEKIKTKLYNENKRIREEKFIVVLKWIEEKGYLPNRLSHNSIEVEYEKFVHIIKNESNESYNTRMIDILNQYPTWRTFNKIKEFKKVLQYCETVGYIPSYQSKNPLERKYNKFYQSIRTPASPSYDENMKQIFNKFITYEEYKGKKSIEKAKEWCIQNNRIPRYDCKGEERKIHNTIYRVSAPSDPNYNAELRAFFNKFRRNKNEHNIKY